jgi:hypothetical protein
MYLPSYSFCNLSPHLVFTLQAAMTAGMQREKSATAVAMRMSDMLFGFIWQALITTDPIDSYSATG